MSSSSIRSRARPLRDAAWWYWLVTLPFVAGAALGCRHSLVVAVGLTVIQALEFLHRDRRFSAFPVQVRLGYLALLLLGAAPGMGWIHIVQTLGTTAMVTFGYCPLARVLSLLPWNRTHPLTAQAVYQTLFTLTPPLPTCS